MKKKNRHVARNKRRHEIKAKKKHAAQAAKALAMIQAIPLSQRPPGLVVKAADATPVNFKPLDLSFLDIPLAPITLGGPGDGTFAAKGVATENLFTQPIPPPPPPPEPIPANPDPWVDAARYELLERAAIQWCQAVGHDPFLIVKDRKRGMAPRYFWTSMVANVEAILALAAPTPSPAEAAEDQPRVAWNVLRYRVTPLPYGPTAAVSVACDGDTETDHAGERLFTVPDHFNAEAVEWAARAYFVGRRAGAREEHNYARRMFQNFNAYINAEFEAENVTQET